MNNDLDFLDDELDSFMQEVQAEHEPKPVDYDMDITYADPKVLKPNPWNPNVVDPLNQMKLEASIRKEGIKRPIVIRELENGDMEIIGGQHRTLAAIALGLPLVPLINRGKISDAEAKKETLIDNFRYGSDDVFKFSELLQDPDIGSAAELLATMPIDEEELAGYFSHLSAETVEVEIDSILGDEDGESETIDLGATTPTRTHQIIRFRVSVDDAAKIGELLKKVRAANGYTEADDMTNDGDALVHVLLTNSAVS